MPDSLEVFRQHRAQPAPCDPALDHRMTVIASGIGQRLLCDLLMDVREAGGTVNDLLALMARLTADSVQFCFRREDHEVALRRVSTGAALLLKADR